MGAPQQITEIIEWSIFASYLKSKLKISCHFKSHFNLTIDISIFPFYNVFMKKSMFDFEAYKNDLINYCYYPCDRNEENSTKRADFIAKHYTDEYLNDIIKNTQKFSGDILKLLKKENKIRDGQIYTEVVLFERGYISNNCSGGWNADRLFFIDETNKPISMYLLEKFFGKDWVFLDTDERVIYDAKEEVGYEQFVLTFNISIPLKKFREICDENCQSK